MQKINDKDIIVVGTDGLFDNINSKDIGEYLS